MILSAACAVSTNTKLSWTVCNTVHISLRDYPPTSKFTFTADIDHFIDAHFFSSAENSYKAKSQNTPPWTEVCYHAKPQHLVVHLHSGKDTQPQAFYLIDASTVFVDSRSTISGFHEIR